MGDAAESQAEHRGFRRWWFALKPPSWPKLLVPMVLGQALGAHASRRFDPAGLAVGAAFTVFALGYIVLLNDYGDRDVDRTKRAMFPSSSPKTIPDGVLSARALLVAGVIAGALAIASGAAGELWLARPGLTAASVAGLAIFAGYTLPPLRMNYRGGGELLEGFGVGVWLPWFNAYAQGGAPWTSAIACALPGFALLSFASGVASGLSDERSDRAGGKRTFATMLGNAAARRLTERSAFLGVLAWVAGAALTRGRGLAGPLAIAAGVALAFHEDVREASGAAVTDAFDAQRAYKGALHKMIWVGALALSAGIALGLYRGR